MNREEFSAILKQIRIDCGISKNQLSRNPVYSHVSQITRLEQGSNNYSLSLVVRHLDILGYNLVVVSKTGQAEVFDVNNVSEWIKQRRDEWYMSQGKLARKIDVHPTTLNCVELGKVTITIDILLKILDVFGYTIKIEKK
jgi:DNA-binding XRE family transcriptional regulator